jgi:hypothetical protein
MQLIKTTLLVVLGFALGAMALPEVVDDAAAGVVRRDTVSHLAAARPWTDVSG